MKRHLSILFLLLGCGFCAGCQQEPIPLEFQLNTEGLESDALSSQQKEGIREQIEAMFGSPNRPYVLPEFNLDYEKIALASGPSLQENEVLLTDEGEVYSGEILEESQGTITIKDTESGEISLAAEKVKTRFEQRGLYRQHCVHCHGVNGDGAGPTARFLKPYPRDFRDGKYKFISTTFKPTPDDLKKTLIEGIPGTSMPSFALLPPSEVDALVEYVKYLSWRGETEKTLIGLAQEDAVEIDSFKEEFQSVLSAQKTVKETDSQILQLEDKLDTLPDEIEDPDELADAEDKFIEQIEALEEKLDAAFEKLDDLADSPGKVVADILSTWELAKKSVVNVGPRPTGISLEESIAKGRELYFSEKVKCFSCHGIDGLGDGLDEKHYDFWNKPKSEKNEHLYALPKQSLKPRNLRIGIYRGGRRPVDIYTRLAVGITPSEMPQYQTLTTDQIWHLVDYVLHMPYEDRDHSGQITALSKPRL